jgi:hypothetical protein
VEEDGVVGGGLLVLFMGGARQLLKRQVVAKVFKCFFC